jgi:hypothetical protein
MCLDEDLLERLDGVTIHSPPQRSASCTVSGAARPAGRCPVVV